MMFSERVLTKKLNWERNVMARKSRHGLSIRDEADLMERDVAARWLARREQQLTKPTKPAPLLTQKSAKSDRPPTSFDQLDPTDPHSQLPDVELRQP
jgi:hypothetical protein